MTLTGPDRDEVFNWDPNEPELMKKTILAGVQIQMPVGKDKRGQDIFPPREIPQNAQQLPSSEPNWVTVKDGSDRIWKPISLFELQELVYAINEECVGKNDRCPPGHLKEMHDSGNEIIKKVRSRANITLSIGSTIRTTSELPKITPPLPEGDTKDLKVWKEYWKVHDKNTRKDTLEKLKKDLRARFVSSNNQWSKGRNSGLIECCNIIDEYLIGEQK